MSESDPENVPSAAHLHFRGRMLDLGTGHARVMGILNVTPDSFSDGGRYLVPDAAVQHATRMLDEGAEIIDVGGASSRPGGATYGRGAAAVAADEEIARVVPVIEALLAVRPGAVVCVDTVQATVARAAFEAGAHIINDITGLRHDPEVADVVAEYDGALVVMHSIGPWGELVHESAYTDVVGEVTDALHHACDGAREAGVKSIVVDPGFGFGKTPDDNLRLLSGIPAFRSTGCPVLIGVSRKSTIGVVLGHGGTPRPVSGRLHGSLSAAALAVLRGASIIRTHDAGPTADVLRVVNRIQLLEGE